jgi:hypothetical protein
MARGEWLRCVVRAKKALVVLFEHPACSFGHEKADDFGEIPQTEQGDCHF